MKSYTQLLSFGCSHTEGGGLNSPQYHAFLSNTKTDDITPTPDTQNYANHHSFPGYLSRLLNCSFINYGKSCAANELIFETAYDVCSTINENDAKHTLVTIQTSLLSRMYIFDTISQQSYTLNSTEPKFSGVFVEHVNNYYLQYVTNFFDVNFEYKKMIRNAITLRSWLKNKGFDVILLSSDSPVPVNPPFFKLPNSDDGTLVRFMHDNKLSISDIPNTTFVDYHMTEIGNQILAEKIFYNLTEILSYD